MAINNTRVNKPMISYSLNFLSYKNVCKETLVFTREFSSAQERRIVFAAPINGSAVCIDTNILFNTLYRFFILLLLEEKTKLLFLLTILVRSSSFNQLLAHFVGNFSLKLGLMTLELKETKKAENVHHRQ